MIADQNRMLGAAALVAGVVAFPAGAGAAVSAPGTGGSGADPPTFVPGELLVRFSPAADAGERAEVRREEDVTFDESLPAAGLQKVETERGTPVREAARQLENRPEVVYAQPNFVREVAAEPPPQESLFDQLWGLDNEGQPVRTASGGSATQSGTENADIDAPEAWDATTGEEGVVAAIVDGGVDYEHPDLAANMVPGRDFCGSTLNPNSDFPTCDGQEDDDPMDEDGHGTHVAGTVGADGTNEGGLVGVNWETSLMPVRVANSRGLTTDALLVEGFAHAVDNHARVVNASFGGKGPPAAEALQQVVRDSRDTLFVVAAGNGTNNDGDRVNNDQNPDFLCNIEADNLVCVTASTQDDGLASFGNFGPRSVDLAAPGVNILSARNGSLTPLDDPFDTDPFSAGWATEGTTTDPVAGSSAAPWGWIGPGAQGRSIADSPGGDYAPASESWATSVRVQPPDPALCTARYDLSLDLDETGTGVEPPDPGPTEGDSLRVQALIQGGETVELARYTESTNGEQSHQLPTLEGAPNVRLRFVLETDAVGRADGAELDDVAVECGRYAVLNGTSMATPHVTGAAALGFAHEESATPTQMKCALMAGVDLIPNPFLFTTASGGRLDASGTLNLLTAQQPAACIVARPAARSTDDTPTFRFEVSRPGSTLQCRLDGEIIDPCPRTFTPGVPDGDHTLQVRARGPGGGLAPWRDPQRAPRHDFVVDTTGPRMGLPDRSLAMSGRRIPVRVRCPASELSGPCSGELLLRSKRKVNVGGSKRKIELGRGDFRVAPGAVQTVVIRTSTANRDLVSRRGKLRTTARAEAFDSLRNTAVRSKDLTLRG